MVATITESSALAKVVRRGQPGICTVCRGSVVAHFDQRGQWVGCPNQKAPDVPFLLIPDRRAVTRPQGVDRRQADQPPARPTIFNPGASSPARTAVQATHSARVVYRAVGRVAAAKVDALTGSDKAVYQVIARRPVQGAARGWLLTALDATKRTGIVDGALRRLRLAGLIKTVAVQG